MKICIVAGGPQDRLPSFTSFNDTDCIWIAVDKGLKYLLESEIMPKYVFGDFDSISKDMKESISKMDMKSFTFETEKDMSDLELALDWAMKQQPEKIIIFGATGGRLDHELTNIQLLYKSYMKCHTEIVDKQNKIIMNNPGTYIIEEDSSYHYISFLSQTKGVKGLTLKGFKYPLNSHYLTYGSSLCVSNELVEKKGTYSFDEGILIMIRSKD